MLKTNRLLQKEQTDLYVIEKKLVKVLPLVQEALNSLKVEELHLKSLALHHCIQGQAVATVAPDPLDISINELPQSNALMNEQINQQEIDLETFMNKLDQFDVEQDSD